MLVFFQQAGQRHNSMAPEERIDAAIDCCVSVLDNITNIESRKHITTNLNLTTSANRVITPAEKGLVEVFANLIFEGKV